MDFIPENIERYSEEHTSAESVVLEKLNRDTQAKVLRPRMLSGHLQGRVLAMFSSMIQPKRILEIGTYTGYSAICLAEGLTADGQLHTIDINEELEDMVQEFVETAGFTDKIITHVGDATEIIPTLKEDWDLVFIDADKPNYPVYYDLVVDQLKPGSYIIADNVLWSGKVAQPLKEKDLDTKIMMDFNAMIQNDPRVENVLFPIRDGLMVCRKL